MGSSQSSHAAFDIKTRASSGALKSSVRGRKRSVYSQSRNHESAPFGLVGSCVSHHSDDVHHPDFDFSERFSEHLDVHEIENLDVASNDAVHTDDYSSLADEELSIDSESSDEEEDVDEEWEEERLRILDEARSLKEVAGFFLHPEAPVASTYGSRCFFDRPSAPPRLSKEEADELGAILDDAKALKKFAVDYLHPEVPVVTEDATACGRNYFSRGAVPEQESVEDSEERALILADAKALKQLATDYLHPEVPVVNRDPMSLGRNYFSRVSAHGWDDADEAKERALILAEMKGLKQLAVDYMHPELPVSVTDANVFGRNYFTRPSACEQESLADASYRSQVMEDMRAFKALAVDFLHPEIPLIANDSAAKGRNYFNRFSAPEQEQESLADASYRSQVMADVRAFKALAVDFLHPEIPIVANDSAAKGRNYFSRFSAPDQESLSDSKVREQVMEDLKTLKKMAFDYLHPEMPVESSDPTSFARNFFSRPSATQWDEDEALERQRILDDAKALKKLAVDYLHPEISVVTTDPSSFGRNYFSRFSSPESFDEVAEEREQILRDMVTLKKQAVDYLHPEIPVVTSDPNACGRNFFTRFSAPACEDEEDADEREMALQDAMTLKKLAVHYLHPEIPVVQSDAAACGRNYFSRPSAPECENVEDRDLVMEDLVSLKKLARDYLHPELKIVTSDPTACGRNYFTRPSAQEYDEEEARERELVMGDLKALKELAVSYLHPEIGVVCTDPAASGRNYFTRPSAPEASDAEVQERELIMQDVKDLKELAAAYLHPERSVINEDPAACGRNYFGRPSAPVGEDEEISEERERIMREVKALKELAVAYLHPELPVVTSDPTTCGRNYFDRPSANAHYYMIHSFPAHEDDYDDYHHHNEHFDHFGMDDEMGMYEDMRHELSTQLYHETVMKNGSEEGGNLSRSPSSIMLFCEEATS